MKHDDHICKEVAIAFGPGGNDQTWKGAAGGRYHLSQFVHQLQGSFDSWRDKGQPVCCCNVGDGTCLARRQTLKPGALCSWRTSLVYNFTGKGQPAHYYNIGNDTGLARRQYGGAIGIVLVVTLVAGIPPCVLRLPVALLILAV